MTLDVGRIGQFRVALTGTLNGTASLNAHDGALVGDQCRAIAAAASSAGRFPVRATSAPAARHSTNSAISLKIEQGIGLGQRHACRRSGRAARGAGQASVPMRDLDLKGTATLISTATDNQFELPFIVQGRWDNPIMLPDPQSLIRHSGAAAPLLDAVKGHTAGEAVRSVIDQLLDESYRVPNRRRLRRQW